MTNKAKKKASRAHTSIPFAKSMFLQHKHESASVLAARARYALGENALGDS